jgi:hypothetical protein
LSSPTGLIDESLPRYDVSSRHAIDIRATPERVWECLNTADLGSGLIHLSLRLRGWDAPRSPLTLAELQRSGFARLAELPVQEIVFGLIEQPWKLRPELRRFDPAAFGPFDEPGFVKIGWNFKLESHGDRVVLSTQTRVLSTDRASRALFGLCWACIWPFSGLFRMEMLRKVRACAQVD